MGLFHAFLALLVVTLWGVNFVAIELVLRELPPIFVTALRFVLAAFPAVFLIRPPAIPRRDVVLFGTFMFAGQFVFLFLAMAAGLSPGLASLVLQLQVFITIGLAVVFLNERPSGLQVIGALLALSGVAWVAVNRGGDATPAGLALVLVAAVSWGIGNTLARRIGPVDMVSLVVWGSLVVPLPLLALSLGIEGPARISQGLATLSVTGLGALAFIVYVSTLFGFSVWSFLLSRYPASTVAPFPLFVPVAGFLSSAAILGEDIASWKIQAALLVLTGLAINLAGQRRAKFSTARPVNE